MIRTLAVEQITLATDRPFEQVVAAFEAQVGTLEQGGWSAISSAMTADKADFARLVTPALGPSGFTRFLTIDHGDWLTKLGQPSKCIMYTLGNPLVAITMLEHDIEAGLDVPVRLAIYAHASGRTHLVYNRPSTLMGALDERVQAAALKLDAKLLALAETVTGASA